MLTKLEEQVLMTVWRFKGEGYGVNVFQYLEEINDKKLTLGVVYDILERLTRNGLVKTQFGSPTPVRGGMRKKYYGITNTGIKELIKSREVYDKVMDGFSELLDKQKTKNI
ncbi:MAG: PadR family transcriptional regulator [bacterium]|nr:PadR family transcriptional regulator [bacterium]